ncbi:MAG: hypothetical protein EA394_08855 [Bacteroidia bacterium]|nr:MAG: hypothetical protein EA394_08855 [Bacteroidia bacterium]
MNMLNYTFFGRGLWQKGQVKPDDVDWSIQPDPDLPIDYPLLTWQLDTNSPLWTIGTGGTLAVPVSGWSHWITIFLMAIAAVVLVVRKIF